MKKTILLSVLACSLLSCSDDDTMTQMSDSELKLVTSSNTTGMISFTNLLLVNPDPISLTVNGTDNDGIFYDSTSDELILASRTNNRLELYSGLKNSVAMNSDNLLLSNSV